jgi:uncharacterized lipoprotein YmbA
MTKLHVEVDLNVDWKLLQDQKGELLKLRGQIECKPESTERKQAVKALSGVIHLIDAIQDQAADQIGSKNVF